MTITAKPTPSRRTAIADASRGSFRHAEPSAGSEASGASRAKVCVQRPDSSAAASEWHRLFDITTNPNPPQSHVNELSSEMAWVARRDWSAPRTRRCSGRYGDQQNKWRPTKYVIQRLQPKNLVAEQALLPAKIRRPLLFWRAQLGV